MTLHRMELAKNLLQLVLTLIALSFRALFVSNVPIVHSLMRLVNANLLILFVNPLIQRMELARNVILSLTLSLENVNSAQHRLKTLIVPISLVDSASSVPMVITSEI